MGVFIPAGAEVELDWEGQFWRNTDEGRVPCDLSAPVPDPLPPDTAMLLGFEAIWNLPDTPRYAAWRLPPNMPAYLENIAVNGEQVVP